MAKTPKTEKPVEAVQVVGPAKGRWRIGRHFTQEPTMLVAQLLSQDELLRLYADPELHVTETTITEPVPAP